MLNTAFSLSPYSVPGSASEYIFIPTSLIFISPPRTLPAHMLLFESEYKQRMELTGREYGLPGAWAMVDISSFSGFRI